MRNFRFVTFVAIAFVFSGRLFAQNLIANGGFENSGSPGMGWNLYIADSTGFAATIEYPTTSAAEGTTYAHVNVTEATVTNPVFDNYKVQLQLPQWVATKNASYKLSFKAKSSAVSFKVGINRGTGDYVNGFDVLLTDTWQSYSCSFTSDTSGNGQLRLNFYVGAETGTYDFDSVTLIRLDTITPVGGNLIDNGGFENAGNPGSGWNLQIKSGFSATIEYPTVGAFEGTTFARVKVTQITGTDPNAYNWMVQLQLPDWTPTKNGIYKLTFKVRSTAPTFKVGINRPGAAGIYVGGFDIPLDTTWQTRSCMFISDTSGVGQLKLNFYVAADTGTYDFDSVSLVMTGTAIPTNSLISNGGFELDGSGWNLYVQTDYGAAATVSYPSTNAPEGSKYASVNVTASSDAQQVQWQLPLFIADSGATYTLTYKARANGSIEIVTQHDASQDYAPIDYSFPDISPEWATYSQTITSPVSGSGALRINFWLGSSMGTYDFDSVSLIKNATAIRSASAGKSARTALTVRKAGAGYAVTLPGLVSSKGAFSLSIYNAAGRMIKRVAGNRNGNSVLYLPLNNLKGTFIIRYSDAAGVITKKTCWVR